MKKKIYETKRCFQLNYKYTQIHTQPREDKLTFSHTLTHSHRHTLKMQQQWIQKMSNQIYTNTETKTNQMKVLLLS